MGTVLLYNITDPQKRVGILLQLRRFGLRWREVAPGEQGLALGALLGLSGYEAADPGGGEPFSDEMLVLYALSGAQFNGLLDGLRRSRATVALKAVVTGQNVGWSSARLHREIAAEHRLMQQK